MFNGTVSLRAAIKGNGLQFSAFEFNPNEPGIDKVAIEGPLGDYLVSTVHVSSVATQQDGRELAAKTTAAALDRLTYHHGVAIEDARITGNHFSPLNPPPGVAFTAETGDYVCVSDSVKIVLGISPVQLKQELELATHPGERYFGLFRSAMLSSSQVEAFLHLYHLLLMLYDSQADVDAFIMRRDPGVPQTQHPIKKSGVMETVYTRLRNEFAHTRPGVNIASTKVEMANRLGALRELTKRAIELHT